MSYPPVPEPTICLKKIEKTIDERFNWDPETRKIHGMSLTIDKLKHLALKSKWEKTPAGDSYRCVNLGNVWRASDVESRGGWDDPRFSDTERILAWRIECIRNNKK